MSDKAVVNGDYSPSPPSSILSVATDLAFPYSLQIEASAWPQGRTNTIPVNTNIGPVKAMVVLSPDADGDTIVQNLYAIVFLISSPRVGQIEYEDLSSILGGTTKVDGCTGFSPVTHEATVNFSWEDINITEPGQWKLGFRLFYRKSVGVDQELGAEACTAPFTVSIRLLSGR